MTAARIACPALLMTKRKRGKLAKIGRQAGRKPGIGFGHIDEIAE